MKKKQEKRNYVFRSKIMNSNDLFQQISHPINKCFKLTEEQLKRYEIWKIQSRMAHIKLEYV